MRDAVHPLALALIFFFLTAATAYVCWRFDRKDRSR